TRPHHLFLLLLLLLGTKKILTNIRNGWANEPAECCFDYFERDINKKFITSYSQTRPDCPKKGIIFYTRRSKEICVSPEQEWVQKVIKYLDKRIF
uniref:C-C motif chemokine n=1 Tax=Scleropages formosus TaxID=113540 RepID=A0A8C9TLS0_SCLFO